MTSRRKRKEQLSKTLDALEAALNRLEANLELGQEDKRAEPLPAAAEGQLQEGYDDDG